LTTRLWKNAEEVECFSFIVRERRAEAMIELIKNTAAAVVIAMMSTVSELLVK
jgi:hypothetical protein